MSILPICKSVPAPGSFGTVRLGCLVPVCMCGLSYEICKNMQKLLGLGEVGTGNDPVV